MASAISSVPFTNSAILPTQVLSLPINIIYRRMPQCASSSLKIKSWRAQQIHPQDCHSLIKTSWLQYDVASTSLKPTACPPLTWLVQPINRIQGQCAAWHMMAAINKKNQLPKSKLFSLCSTEFFFKILNERQ